MEKKQRSSKNKNTRLCSSLAGKKHMFVDTGDREQWKVMASMAAT